MQPVPRVDLRRIEIQIASDGYPLRGESLVRLDDIHVGRLHAGLLERIAHRRHWAESHQLRLDTRLPVGNETRERLQPALARDIALHHHDGRARVIEARGVGRGPGPSFLNPGRSTAMAAIEASLRMCSSIANATGPFFDFNSIVAIWLLKEPFSSAFD